MRVVLLLTVIIALSCNDAKPQQPPLVLEEIYTVGALDAPEHEIFGMYLAVALARDGQLYVGDQSAKEIRVFDYEGNYLKTLGRKGQGPGEYQSIISLALTPDEDSLYVYDFINGRVSVYDTKNLEYNRTFKLKNLETKPYKMYFINDKLLFVGNRVKDHTLAHLFDIQGNYFGSFGTLLNVDDENYDTPFMWNQLNQGMATGMPDGGIILALLAPYRIAGYSKGGRLKWLVKDDVLPDPWDGYIEYTPNRYSVSTYPQIVSIYSLTEEYFIVFVYDLEHEKAFYDIRNSQTGILASRNAFKSDIFMETMIEIKDKFGLAAVKNTDPYPYITVSRWFFSLKQ
jgi:WD40 repeat protein